MKFISEGTFTWKRMWKIYDRSSTKRAQNGLQEVSCKRGRQPRSKENGGKKNIPWKFRKWVTNSYVSTFHFIEAKEKRYSAHQNLWTEICRHPRYIPTNFGRQTDALYRDRAVPVFIMTDALGFRFTLVCLLSHSNMCTDRHSTATFAFGVMSWYSGSLRCKTSQLRTGWVRPVSELGFTISEFTDDAFCVDVLTIIRICGSHIIQNDILRLTSHRLAKQARHISSYRSVFLLYFSLTLRTQVYVTSLRPSYGRLYITSVGLLYRSCVTPKLHNQSISHLRYDICNHFTSPLRFGIYNHFTSPLRYGILTSQRFSCYT